MSLAIADCEEILVVDYRTIANELSVSHESFMALVVEHFGKEKTELTALDVFGIWSHCCTYGNFQAGIKLSRLLNQLIDSDLLLPDDKSNLIWIRAAINYQMLGNFAAITKEEKAKNWFTKLLSFVSKGFKND